MDLFYQTVQRISQRCSEPVHESIGFLERLPSICENRSSENEFRDQFAYGGVFHNVVRCALDIDVSWANFAGNVLNPSLAGRVMCPDASGATHAYEGITIRENAAPLPTALRWGASAVLMLLVLGAVGAVVRVGVKKAQRHRTSILCWWFALTVSCLPLSVHVDRSVDPDGFVMQDENTECAFRLSRALPGIVAKDHALTVILPTAYLFDTYRTLLTTPIVARRPGHGAYNTTLLRECGACGVIAWNRTHIPSPPLTKALLVHDLWATTNLSAASHGEVLEREAAFTLRLPLSVSSAHRHTFMQALRMPSDRVLYGSLEQSVLDSEESTQPSPWILGTSFTLMVGLVQGTARVYVESGALLITLGTLVTLCYAMFLADGLMVLVDLPMSPFNVMAFPLVVGTGVDSLFLFLYQRCTGSRRWVAEAMPSIVASQLSTCVSFLIGTYIRIPHVRNFFVYMTLSLMLSLGVQLTAFPAMIVKYTRTRTEDPEDPKDPRDRQRIAWWSDTLRRCRLFAPILLVLVLWTVILQYKQPLNKSFDVRKQLRDDTMTHRLIVGLDDFMHNPTSMVYALTEGFSAKDWQGIDDRFLSSPCVTRPTSMSWHSQVASGTSIRGWLNDSRTSLLFGDFFNVPEEMSASLFLVDFDMGVNATRAHQELQCLGAARTADTCFVSYERLGGYTVVELIEQLKWLACASSIVATLFGIAIMRGRGAFTIVTLFLSYGGAIGIISILHLSIDMLLVAVMLIAPGLIVDFSLHLMFHRNAIVPVLMSGITSIVSVVPYLWMRVESVRHFAFVYCLFIALGMVHAFALSATTTLVNYVPVGSVELEALDP